MSYKLESAGQPNRHMGMERRRLHTGGFLSGGAGIRKQADVSIDSQNAGLQVVS